jgi:hypothetical protein
LTRRLVTRRTCPRTRYPCPWLSALSSSLDTCFSAQW